MPRGNIGIQTDRPVDDVVSGLEMFVHEQEPTDEPRSMSLLAAHASVVREQLEVNDGNMPAIPSGLATLDEVLSLRKQRYTILAGGTSMGKTAKALHMTYAAAKAGYGVGFVSREMPERDLAARINSIESQIPYKAFERKMSENLTRQMIETAKAQQSLPIEIFSPRVDDMPAIISEAKKLKAKWEGTDHPLSMLVVDYIQLINDQGKQFEVLSKVANDLKQLAKMLDVHVLALAQIDRKVMERENARPMLSDLRGSGDLENAPDNVLLFTAMSILCGETQPPAKTEDRVDFEEEWRLSKGKMEIIIAKARMGEIKTITVGCDMATNRFWDIETTGDLF
ncbi:DnaB-like helicase C-terminal domain-containing protein [Vibrio hannami]|uniref:replicative DNA helicase n=1 Tax=Vibrio hannami TaxID=2717094 RepID=UPI0024100FEE|nr:DnaB-like helicase C-terminal domain-containing protein [Vibrio hannami]MDG3089187.1 DnaB-like helicase C-terminal domain-containing protein [Vibrio hannami]